MKLTRIILGDCKQFKYVDIDLCYSKVHPTKAGQPLEKICFIGKNGTGKTTILNFIKHIYLAFKEGHYQLITGFFGSLRNDAQWCIEVELNSKRWLIGHLVGSENQNTHIVNYGVFFVNEEFYKNNDFDFEKIFNEKSIDTAKKFKDECNRSIADIDEYVHWNTLEQLMRKALIIHSPTEYQNNFSAGQWNTTADLNQSLTFANSRIISHEISFENVNKFWQLLVYNIQLRERQRKEFEELPENRFKTKDALIKQFDQDYPEILKVIAERWQIVLDDAGLYFDHEDVKKPVILTDHLSAFIKLKRDKKQIEYSSLSSGIKNLILTIGYLTALYFQKNIERAIALFDEPEFSLFPDLQLKLIDLYTNSEHFPNTQFFFATHSPMIASQFEPDERICLQFDEDRFVFAKKGIAPLGDDPVDLLLQDFQLPEVMSKHGVEMWHRYINLQKQLESKTNEHEIKAIMLELIELRMNYKFPVNYEPNNKKD